MTQPTHTPAPWNIGEPDEQTKIDGTVGINADGWSNFARVVWLMSEDEFMLHNSPICEANARLIAAAPELLEALEREVKYLNGVAALIEARNGIGSVLADEIARPLRIKALGLGKVIAKARG